MSKSRLSLIIILALCMLSCLFAGCSIGFETYEEVLEKYNIAAQVTYYGNGGYFSESPSILSMEIEFTSGSKFYNVGTTSRVDAVTRSNYDLVGWYYVDQRTITEETEDGETEEVLYFVLDVTDEYVEQFKVTADDGTVSYYFEYTSELTTVDIEEDEDDEDDSSTSSGSSSGSDDEDEDEFEDDEIDYSNLTNRMYFIKADDGEWIMSLEDYDYYIRLKKQNTDDDTINVPDLKLGDAVDVTMTLEDGSHLYVVADWVKSVSINYVLAMKDGETATSITVNGEEVKVGEVIYREYFGTATSISRSDASGLPISVTLSDATVLAFYYDAACTQPVNGASISKPAENLDGTIDDVIIYAQCISGVYEVVRGDSDVRTMFNGGSEKYYIYSDIDCSLVTVSPMTAFSGEIRGNGYTLSNLNVTKENLTKGTTTSLFGTILDGAKITDLTIDTVTVTYTTRAVQELNIYLVGIIGDDVKAGSFDISGLTLNNVTVSVTLATYNSNADINGGYTIINNIQYLSAEGKYEDDNWLYGTIDAYLEDKGVYETDDEIIAVYGGADINNAKLYVQAGNSGEKVLVAEID